MATCAECGAPVMERALACTYCGADLNVIGENLGSLILSNVEAVKAALAEGRHLGLHGRHLEPVTFKDLNREYFMPLFEHKDRGIVMGRLVEAAGEPPELLIEYQVLFPGEDPARIKVDWIRKVVFAGGVHQWFGGWRRCPSCSGRYHISRVVSSERELHDADDCPLCVTRELAKQLGSLLQAAQTQLEAARLAVPKKRWLATDIERKRYRDACEEVADLEELIREWSDPDPCSLLDDVAALAQAPLVGRDAASERREVMRELEQLAAHLGRELQRNSREEPRARRDTVAIAREPNSAGRRRSPQSLAAVPVVLGLAVAVVWGVPSFLSPDKPGKGQGGASVPATGSATTTEPRLDPRTSRTVRPSGPTFESVTETGTDRAMFALPSRAASSVIEASYTGRSPFTLDVVSDKGKHVATLVQRSGPYSGTTFVEPARDYPFFLKVNTRGAWKIKITPDATLASLDRSITGNGDTVLRSPGHPGNWTFTYSGKSYFRVRLVGDRYDDLLVGSDKPCRRTVRVRSGEGLLLIKADGPWSIELP